MSNKSVNVVIVGGGSTWSPGILKALTKHLDIFKINELKLYDIDEKRQEKIGEFGKILFREEAPEVKFSYTTDPEVAFENVDFVLCQMRTGGYPMREKDEKIPLSQELIGQETCGPGGFAYGLRSIRDMIELVSIVRRKSPEAWIINYTNPAAIVAVALNKVFPDDHKILNICDQPVNLLRSFGRLIQVDYNRFEPKYFGLNHFGWFTHVYDKITGEDYLPLIKKTTLEKGFLPADAEQRDQSWLDTYGMVETMVRDFPDYLPNTYLQYYLYPDYKITKLDPNYTRANEVMDGREKRVFEECNRIIKNNSAKDSHIVHNDAHGDMIVECAASILNNTRNTFIIMTPNNGIVSNLPDDLMIEVPALLGVNGVEPFAVGKIGTFYKGLIESQYAYEKLTVEAYLEGSYEKALQALTLNRLVVDAKRARKVLDSLIEANSEYWPELK